MAKLTLTDITAGHLSVATFNANNSAIEAALENTLSRDGTSPNTMSANLDMNSNKITNLTDATNNQDAVTYAQLLAANVTIISDLDDIVNVVLTAEADGDLIRFDGSNWVNVSEGRFLRSDAADIKTSGILRFDDNVSLTFGSSDDVSMAWNGTQLNVTQAASAQNIWWRDGAIHRFYDASDTMYLRLRHVPATNDFEIAAVGGGEDLRFTSWTEINVFGGTPLRVWDSANTGRGQLDHDTTDFNFTLANTTDVNFTGITGKYDFDEDVYVGSGAVMSGGAIGDKGQVGPFVFIDWNGSVGRVGAYDYDAGSWQNMDIKANNLDIIGEASIDFQVPDGSNRATIGTTVFYHYTDVYIRTGETLRIYDSGNDDYFQVDHDGTEVLFSTVGTGAGSVPIRIHPGASNQVIIGGDGVNSIALRITDGDDSDYLDISCDGTDINFAVTGGGALDFAHAVLRELVLEDIGYQSASETVSANAVTLTYSEGPAFEVDLEAATGAVTITISGGPESGNYGIITVKVQQDSTADRTITWAGGTFVWLDGSAHTQQTGSDAISIYTFETWDGGTTWYATGADYS